MPAAFLYCAVKMGLSPLNAVCLALLISTVASSLCWGFEKGFDDSKQMLEATKQDFFKQLTVVEEQLKEKKTTVVTMAAGVKIETVEAGS